ncbi:retrotransposon protein, putative, ty1-copia subclass [Tanacetum coccineum]
MTGAKFDIEKFDETGDFGLWRIKMRALLIQHGCEAVLEVLPADMEAQTKTELNKKAHSAVILCLGNKVLREVTGKTTAARVWSKIETLYMKKSLANKLYLKKKLYTLSLTLEDVMATLNSKKIKERSKAKGDDGEGLYVRGRTDRKDSRQSRGKSRSKSRGEILKCYICQSDDHLKRNCPKNNRKKSIGYAKTDEQPSSSGSTYDDSKVMMVMSAQAQALLDWIIDSGCSYYMTPRLDILFDFLECDGGNVQLGDNRECKIKGIGKVRIQLKDGSSFVLHNVRYIPELKRNLISLGTLKKEGFTVKLQLGKIKVINGSSVVLSGIRRDNCVYSLNVHALAGELNANVEEKDSLAQVWHKRLGHISEAGLQVLEKQGLFDKKSLDLWGPSQVESLGGKRYFLSIVDDYSRRHGRTIKKLRTDNGLEFCNWEFEQLCIESEIARYLTVVETPSSSTAIEKKTPMKMWSGHPSNYGMLRIFGCVAYPDDKQGKLEPRTIKCVLLGYPEGVKGYRLYRLDGESPKIVTSKNVVFNESVMYKDTLKDSSAGDKSVEELQVEVELQRLSNHMPKEDQKDQEDGDDKDVGDQATNQPPDLTDYQLVRDREPRTRTKPLRFRDEIACEDSSKWKAAMEEEMDSLRKNKTWELVDHPAGQKLVSCKWLFKINEGLKVFKSLGTKQGWWLVDSHRGQQLDVKTAFLHGNLEEVIYMRQPTGYEQGNKEYEVKQKILVWRSSGTVSRKILRVSQSGYGSKILNNFRIDNGKSVKMTLGGHFKLSLKDCPGRDYDVERISKVPYANAVGSLMYLMGCVVSWKATLQHVVALSTTEAEYMALTEAVKQAIWLRGLLEELGVELNTVAVNCDNQGAIHLLRNHVFMKG